MINIIAAMTRSGVIGKDNSLPWNIPDEMKHFRSTTTGCTVIMGLRTFESIGRPLPNRNNIVLGPPDLVIPGVTVCSSVENALMVAKTFDKENFVIGGAYTYAQFLPYADRLFMSYIKQDYDGNVFFPEWDQSEWEVIERIEYSEFEFVLYERVLK